MNDATALKWLKLACWSNITLALTSSLATFPATQAPFVLLFDVLRWPIDGSPSTFDDNARAVSAVLGGVMVGWMAMFLYLIHSQPNQTTFKALSVSILTWFIIDSGFSYYILPGTVILNLLGLALFMPPLMHLTSVKTKSS